MATECSISLKEIVTPREFQQGLPLLWHLIGKDDPKGLTNDLMLSNFPKTLEHGYRHFHVMDGERIIGFVGLMKCFHVTFPRPGYELTNFIIDPSAQNQGIGSHVITLCQQKSLEEGVNWFRLLAERGNQKTMSFYRKNGFEHSADYMFQVFSEDETC